MVPLPLLVFGNLFVSVCAASLVLASWVELGLAVAWLDPMVGLVFFATWLVYNLDRIAPTSPEDRARSSDEVEDARLVWIETRRPLLWGGAAAAACGALACAWWLEVEIFAALVPMGLLSLAYTLPVVPGRAGWGRLKDIPGLKIFLIALVWATATVSLPAWHRGVEPWRPEVLWLTAERALFIFVITLPFDVRDMARDRLAGVRTLPHLLGVGGTRKLAIGGLCVYMASVALRHAAAGLVWPVAASTLVTGALLARLDEGRPPRYYAVYMEGTMVLQAALVLAWWGLTT